MTDIKVVIEYHEKRIEMAKERYKALVQNRHIFNNENKDTHRKLRRSEYKIIREHQDYLKRLRSVINGII